MKKIVTVIKPFTLKQNIYVYEDNEIIDVTQAELKDLEETIISKADEYQTPDVTLVGARKFSAGIKKKIENAEMTRYNKNQLNIEVRAN